MNNKGFFTCLLSFLLVFSTIPFHFENGILAETTQESKSVEFSTYGTWPALSPDGKTVFVGKRRKDNAIENVYNIGMYNTENGSLIKTIEVDNNTEFSNYSSQGNYVVLTGETVLFLDGKTGDKLFSLPYLYAEHSFKETDDSIVAFVHSTDETYYDKDALTIYDTKSQSVIYEKRYEEGLKMHVALHPTLPIVAVSHGTDVEIINYETKKLLTKIENPFNFREEFWAIFQLSFSPDGKLNMINAYGAKNPFLQYIPDENQQYTLSSFKLNAYVNETENIMETRPRKISYGKNNEIILHYFDKIKFFDSTNGSYLKTIDGKINEVTFSKNMEKIAYTKNVYYSYEQIPSYVVVQDYPIKTQKVNTIEFKDPAIALREGNSTYYSLEYIDQYGKRSLLDPEEFKLESLDQNVITIDSTNKIVSHKPGNTLVKATYNGLIDYLSVEVKEKSTSKISVETLYESSTVIKGTAPAGATLHVKAIKAYQTIVKEDGTFVIELDEPLQANTLPSFMTWTEDAIEGEQAHYLFESVIRDTVAPKPPTITEIDESTSVVEGITEPNATITISANQTTTMATSSSTTSRSLSSSNGQLNPFGGTTSGKTTFTVKASKDGKFKLSLKGMAGKVFKATATDLVGNRSKPTNSKIADTKAPSVPRVYTFSDASPALTGVTEPNAKVHVRKNGKLIGNVLASQSGGFSVKVPKQTVGTVLTVTATDSSNNISKATTVKTLKAPKSPTVNKITSSSKNISGKAQPYTTIIVKNGSKVLGTNKANRNGQFSVKIVQQKKGTKLSVVSKNSLGAVSAPTVITVK
ncbi:Ig-like domain-containing protein [Gottfriedia solisilvae]|uniref:Ig-like domain-containing protein n=1 Tax=Gottfriedia solisilvae TaxID=1516104 RepID=UPI003D2F1AA5